MPGDVDYAIGLKIAVDSGAVKTVDALGNAGEAVGQKIERGSEQGRRGLERLKSGAEEVKEVLVSIAAAVGLEEGLRGMYKMLVGSNAELQEHQRALTGVIAANYELKGADTLTNFNKQLQVSSELMESFGEATRHHAGLTRAGLAEVATILTPGMSQARKSTEEIKMLTTDIVRWSKVTGHSASEVASEAMLALETGMVRPRSILASGLHIHGDRNHPEKIFSEIEKSINRLPLDRMEKETRTWGDWLTLAREQIDQIMEIAGKPVFEEMSSTLKDITGYLETHREDVEAIAKKVGGEIRDAFISIRDAGKFVVDHWDEVKTISEGIAIIWAGSRMLGALREMAGLAGSIGKNLGLSVGEHGAGGGGFSGIMRSLGGGVVGMEGVEAAETGFVTNLMEATAALGPLAAVAGALTVSLNAWGEEQHKSQRQVNKLNDEYADTQLDLLAHLANTEAKSFLGESYDAATGKQVTALGYEYLERMLPILEENVSRGITRREEYGGKTVEISPDSVRRLMAQWKPLIDGVDQPLTGTAPKYHVQNYFNFDKSHDADEIAFSVAELMRSLSENPPSATKAHTTIHHS